MTYNLDDLPAKLRRRITVNPDTGCWIVANTQADPSPTSTDYRGIGWAGKLWQTHVLAYTLLAGPVPDRMALDHVYDRGCRSKACCNPAHLEPVTYAENSRRRIAARWPGRLSDTDTLHPLATHVYTC